MKTSCIRHPENNRYIQVYEWMVRICQDNHCAAFLLSHFVGWHDWKLRHDAYYKRSNDIAEEHGEGRPHDQNAYLFFTVEDFYDGMFGAYGKNSIKQAVELLEKLRLISIHKNPNPKYHFDKTKYFRFYPHVCNEWIEENYSSNCHEAQNNVQVVDNYDNSKEVNRYAKKGLPSAKINLPSIEIGKPITDTTINTTNKNKSINSREKINFSEKEQVVDEIHQETVQYIVDALIAKGMPSKRFYPDAIVQMNSLVKAGATVDLFAKAYEMSTSATQGNNFGIPYLAKVIHEQLAKSKRQNFVRGKTTSSHQKDNFSETVYEKDIRNNLKWIKGRNNASDNETK